MIFLIILFFIIAVICLILIAPIKLKLSYIDGKISYKLTYLFIPAEKFLNFVNRPEKSKKQKDIPKVNAPANEQTDDTDLQNNTTDKADKVSADAADDENFSDKSQNYNKKKSSKSKSYENTKRKSRFSFLKTDMSDNFKYFLKLWECGSKWFKWLFKRFNFSDAIIDFKISDEDAYDCALKYGRISALTYNGLSLLSRIFTVNFKSLDVVCAFAEDKSKFNFSFILRFRLISLLNASIAFLIAYYFKIYRPKHKKSSKKIKKPAVSG